jgi:hypothetical protein
MSVEVSYKGRTATVLLSFVILAGLSDAYAQMIARQSGRPESSSNDKVGPQLLNADTNPTLRFPIARMGHMNATISFGWLDITRDSVRYHVEQPAEKSRDSFEVPRQQIRGLDFQGLFLEFSSPKLQRIFFLPPGEWESLHSGIGIVSAAEGGTEATQSIAQAIRNFDFALALARPRAPETSAATERPVATPAPSPQPAAAAATPNIVVVVPVGAGGQQTVEADTSPLVIRGAVTDAGGIPVVTINGSSANMRPQSHQAAEFWSDPLPLQPGENHFDLSAVNTAHVETHLVVRVHFRPKTAVVNLRGLDKQEILGLLHGGVPASHVADLVKERGIKFRPTADDLNLIRAEGGSDELIQAVQKAVPEP